MDEKILVIDVETGGLDVNVHSLLSIAGVVLDTRTKEIKTLFDIFVKEPFLNVEKQAMEINKINLHDVIEKGFSPTDAVEQIVWAIQKEFGLDKKVTLAGQNVGFDIGFLKRLFEMGDKPYKFEHLFSYRSIDTASILTFLNMTKMIDTNGKANLDALIKAAKVPYEDNVRHTSGGDARLTAHALMNLIDKISTNVSRLAYLTKENEGK